MGWELELRLISKLNLLPRKKPIVKCLVGLITILFKVGMVLGCKIYNRLKRKSWLKLCGLNKNRNNYYNKKKKKKNRFRI